MNLVHVAQVRNIRSAVVGNMETEIYNILGREPKENLNDCLNDCDIRTLKNICYFYSDKRLNSKNELINYLKKKIPNKFREYIKSDFSIYVYNILKEKNVNNLFNEDLASCGFLFHYHYEDSDRDCVNVIPKELLEIYKKEFSVDVEKKYIFNLLKDTISNYLLVTGIIPKKSLRKNIYSEKIFKGYENLFDEAILESDIRTYGNDYSIMPKEMYDFFKDKFEELSYEPINIKMLDKSCSVLNEMISEIMKILKLDISNKDDYFIKYIDICIHLCFSYNYACEIDENLKSEYNLSSKDAKKIKDLVINNIHMLRFWDMNGRDLNEYQQTIYLKCGVMSKKPKKTTIKDCLEALSKEGFDIISTFYEVDNLDDTIKKITESSEALIDADDNFLLDFISLNNAEYTDRIPGQFYYLGIVYLYKDNDKIKMLIPDEIYNKINKKFSYGEVYSEEEILINRYIKANGVITLDKLLELLNNNHNLGITKERLCIFLNSRGVPIIDNKYVSFLSNFPKKEFDPFLKIKDLYGKYKKQEFDECDYAEDLLCVLDEYTEWMDLEQAQTIKTIMISMIFYGIYTKDELVDNLKDNGLDKYANDLDMIAKKYKNKVGIWVFNGYTLNDLQARSNKVGRNEPCPCGSGKKYKKCCGR